MGLDADKTGRGEILRGLYGKKTTRTVFSASMIAERRSGRGRIRDSATFWGRTPSSRMGGHGATVCRMVASKRRSEPRSTHRVYGDRVGCVRIPKAHGKRRLALLLFDEFSR